MSFDVTCENIAYTDQAGMDCELTPDQLITLNRDLATAFNGHGPLVFIQSMHVSEDDDQEEDDRKLFVVIVLRIDVENEKAAIAQIPADDFFNAALTGFNALEKVALSVEETWEVTDCQES